MTALYPGTSVTGYNANPPPDDGTTVPTNLITWAGIKQKLGDPLNTFAAAIDSNLTAAFGKTLDGAGVVSTAVDYAMTGADQGRLIEVTVAGKTVTTPDAGTVNAPFVFAINNQSTGSITLAGNATNSQTVDGQTTQVILPGGGCVVKTDGTNWFTYGLKPAQVNSGGSSSGVGLAVNAGLTASVGSSLLTVALKTVAGNDPSAGDQVLIPFRDTTIANGDPVWVPVTASLSINTNATGATLGTQSSGVPFRFWVVAFNNAGTVVLALWHSGAGSTTTGINSLNPGVLASTTGISSGATSAGVFYTPNGTSLSGKSFCILGYVDYASGLTTAGTYASVPTVVQLFGPGIRKPGEVVNSLYNSTGSYITGTNTYTPSATPPTTAGATLVISQAIVPTAAVNLTRVSSHAVAAHPSGSATLVTGFIYNGSSVLSVSNTYHGTSGMTSLAVSYRAVAGGTSSVTYTLYATGNTSGGIAINGGSAQFYGGAGNTFILVEEIMA